MGRKNLAPRFAGLWGAARRAKFLPRLKPRATRKCQARHTTWARTTKNLAPRMRARIARILRRLAQSARKRKCDARQLFLAGLKPRPTKRNPLRKTYRQNERQRQLARPKPAATGGVDGFCDAREFGR